MPAVRKEEIRHARGWRHVLLGCVVGAGVASVAAVAAQQNTVLPQPRAAALPAPGPAHANRNQRVAKPEGLMPTVPAGFSVSSVAELQAPRMMVYAPNGDLFVSSPDNKFDHGSTGFEQRWGVRVAQRLR